MALPYTKKNRFIDVLWLLQTLALEDYGQRTIGTLNDKRKPLSAKSWDNLANEHPELFHVSTNKGTEISLNARRNKEGTPPLTDELTAKLIEIAIKIYDSQINHSRWWIYVIPIVGAFLGALLGILFKK